MRENFWYFENLELRFKSLYNLDISREFLRIAGEKLWKEFIKGTGITSHKNICIGIPSTGVSSPITTIDNNITKLNWYIVVIAQYFPVVIYWKSKDGTLYKANDSQIDENNIVFWFEGLDPVSYHKYLYPNDPLPFRLKNIYFKVEIKNIMTDCQLEIFFDGENPELRDKIFNSIDILLDKWNEKSEKAGVNDESGVVHSWKIETESEGYLNFYIDLGSADAIIVKKIIQKLNRIEGIAKVVIE